MDKDYLNNLKQTNLRPGKIKIERFTPKETILMEQGNNGEGDLQAEIIKWFMKNPNPPDEKVHAFAEKMGVEHDKFEAQIYKILSSVLSGGKSPGFKGSYDPKQVQMGIKVEMEHTTNPLIAEKITKDHLTEIKDYYTRLDKMESGAGVVHEIFVQSSEIAAMPPGQERDLQILRLGMIAELDAVNLYNKLAELASSDDVSKLMLDISREEKVHAGEFETLMERIEPDYEKAEEEGEGEVEDLLNL